MKKKQKEILNNILSDKTSGSSEILAKFNKFLLSNIKEKEVIIDSLCAADTKLSHFAVIKNYINDLSDLIVSDNPVILYEYFRNHDEEDKLIIENIFNNIYKKLPSAKTLFTISKSGTIVNVLKLWHKKRKKLKIIITESRPASEGKLTARELLKCGLRVEMITDAMAGIFIPKSDAVIIGADAVLNNGSIINKTGSLSLALLCRHFKKPLYVLAAKSKFVNRNKYKINMENSDKVWKYSHQNLKTINIPFEEIERKLITEIISE